MASASAIGQSETQTASAAREQSAAKNATSGSKRQTHYLSQGWDMLTTFKGTDLVGRDNIGFVNDMLFDGTAKISGVVAGVGGFCGIGAKNVQRCPRPFRPVTTSNAPAGNANDPTNIELKIA